MNWKMITAILQYHCIGPSESDVRVFCKLDTAGISSVAIGGVAVAWRK
jgi:hypothetical protein